MWRTSVGISGDSQGPPSGSRRAPPTLGDMSGWPPLDKLGFKAADGSRAHAPGAVIVTLTACRSPAAPSRRRPGRATGSPARSTSTRSPRRPRRRGAAAALVHFTPGARTAWHTHPLGQTIFVTEGVGRCRRRGGPIEVIRPGDRVFFEPGEDHWHGAAPDRFMAHVAIQEADESGSPVTWGEHVSDEEYGAAEQAATSRPAPGCRGRSGHVAQGASYARLELRRLAALSRWRPSSPSRRPRSPRRRAGRSATRAASTARPASSSPAAASTCRTSRATSRRRTATT